MLHIVCVFVYYHQLTLLQMISEKIAVKVLKLLHKSIHKKDPKIEPFVKRTRMMGLKKKKNVIILTACMIISFILYQLYIFLMITSEAGVGEGIIPVMDHQEIEELKKMSVKHIKSESDRFINSNGIIHGVLDIHMSKYRPDSSNQFKCLKSEQRIPFEFVNDDYCDCEDGTDEPCSNACNNGIFYCDTQFGKKPKSFLSVPSSQVNDGICDCCDGSDEWLHNTKSNEKLLSQLVKRNSRHYVTKCTNNCNVKALNDEYD